MIQLQGTCALLDGSVDHTGAVWDGITTTLERLGQPHQEPVLGRNLRALIGARSRARGTTN